MRNSFAVTLLLCSPVLSPLDMKSLNFLVQPRNGLGPSHHRVEKLDLGTGWLVVGKQGRTPREGSARTLPNGCRWVEQLVNWPPGTFGD